MRLYTFLVRWLLRYLVPFALILTISNVALSLLLAFSVYRASRPAVHAVVPIEVIRAQVYDFTNQARLAAGLPALTYQDNLTALAQYRADDMAARHYFSHWPAPGLPIFQQILDAWHIPYQIAGENIGRWPGPEEDLAGSMVRAWMASEDHRANILYPSYTDIGVGVAIDSQMVAYMVQVFVQAPPQTNG